MAGTCLSVLAWLMMLLAMAFSILPALPGIPHYRPDDYEDLFEDRIEEGILERIWRKIKQLVIQEGTEEELIEIAKRDIKELKKTAFVICPYCGEPIRVPVRIECLPQSLSHICNRCGKKLKLDVDVEGKIVVFR